MFCTIRGSNADPQRLKVEDGRVFGSMACLQEVVVWRSQPTSGEAESYRDR